MQVLHRFKEGDYFGEIALLTHERRTANCRAATFCELWYLTRSLLNEVLEDYPKVEMKLQQVA